jgi:phosphonoacetate hydrolase
MPSFTNVNNAAITTGMPPEVTGISGNYFLDPDTGEEVMMNSAKYLRCETILAAAARAGRKVAMVTAKEKLRDILSRDLKGMAFSAEKASEAKKATHGIDDVEELVGRPQPKIYGADASLYVLDAGIALIRAGRADFLYLSLTDWVQHAFAPDEPEALQFMAAIDRRIGELLDLGAVVGATADHGMNAKANPDGSPRVVFIESEIDEALGTGAKVICPITDPYVAHHGALGSAVTVHLAEHHDVETVAAHLRTLPGVEEVFDRDAAAAELELPADRIGDLYVLAASDAVLGRTLSDHDLSQLHGTLRSHGGMHETMVPMLVSEPIDSPPEECRNFDIFQLTCNFGADA